MNFWEAKSTLDKGIPFLKGIKNWTQEDITPPAPFSKVAYVLRHKGGVKEAPQQAMRLEFEGDAPVPGKAFDDDVEALIDLIEQMRKDRLSLEQRNAQQDEREKDVQCRLPPNPPALADGTEHFQGSSFDPVVAAFAMTDQCLADLKNNRSQDNLDKLIAAVTKDLPAKLFPSSPPSTGPSFEKSDPFRVTECDFDSVMKGSTKGLDLTDFFIVRFLGSGAHGPCFKVALRQDKAITATLMVAPLFNTRGRGFRRGSQLAKMTSIDDPHFVRCHGFFAIGTKEPTHVGLVMEECLYTLWSVIDSIIAMSPKLKVRAVCGILDELLQGLETLSIVGVLHGDITTHNNLLGKDGLWKIANYGFAPSLSFDDAARRIYDPDYYQEQKPHSRIHGPS